MDDVIKGFVAGLAATAVISVLMFINLQTGMVKGLDVISILAQVVDAPGQPLYGWAAHFVVGMFLWGGLFALASDFIGGPFLVKGVLFGILSWLVMMVVFFPLAGHAMFATDLGTMVPVVTFVLHVIFGLVLGFVYRSLGGTSYTVDKLT